MAKEAWGPGFLAVTPGRGHDNRLAGVNAPAIGQRSVRTVRVKDMVSGEWCVVSGE
jgi:hypothetical protein